MQEISSVNDFGLVFTIVMAILLLVLPRKSAPIALIMTALYLTQGQVVMIGPFNFTMIRIMLLVGLVRSFAREGVKSVEINTIDKYFIAWVISAVLIKTLLWQTSEVFINRLGFAYDAIGSYFLFRILIKDTEDITRFLKYLAITIVPLTIAMAVEMSTARNVFSVFGGVPEFSEIRQGLARCQGSFRHPILAGTFGATLMPLYVGLWSQGGDNRKYSLIGFVCSSFIAIAANSSGPVMSYIFAIVGLIMWLLRQNMRQVRWAIVAILFTAHMLMQSSVWFLIARLSEVLGGSGWHRSQLIEQAITYFDEWWLLGTKTTAHWMSETLLVNPDSADITNHFIGVGVNGGLITLILFIMIIIQCYKYIGRSLESRTYKASAQSFLLWTLGVTLFAHIVSFISVSYFDQIQVFWYALLAMIASATGHEQKQKAVSVNISRK